MCNCDNASMSNINNCRDLRSRKDAFYDAILIHPYEKAIIAQLQLTCLQLNIAFLITLVFDAN